MALGEREEGEESAADDPAPAPSTTAESEAPLGSLLSTRAHAESHLVTERAIAGPRCASSSLIGKERETERGAERHERGEREEGNDGGVGAVGDEEEAFPASAFAPPPPPPPPPPGIIAAVLVSAALLSFTTTHPATTLLGSRWGSAASSLIVVRAGSTLSTTPERNLAPAPPPAR